MRRIVLLISGLALLPALAGAEPRGECRKLTRQIAHFEGVVEMAQERDNALWEAETRRHIERLERRRERRCPEPVESEGAIAAMGELLRKASKVAAAYLIP